MAKIFIDAENGVMGRVASYAAKQALQGNEVVIVNSEKALISGNNTTIIQEFKELRRLNTNKPEKGPFISRVPEKIMKRCVRGMIPDYRLGRGKIAFHKIKTYDGIPEEFKKEKMMKFEARVPKKYITIEELGRLC
jgi:large subunit ribosomal protein L13